jgi:hypothetical protein
VHLGCSNAGATGQVSRSPVSALIPKGYTASVYPTANGARQWPASGTMGRLCNAVLSISYTSHVSRLSNIASALGQLLKPPVLK